METIDCFLLCEYCSGYFQVFNNMSFVHRTCMEHSETTITWISRHLQKDPFQPSPLLTGNQTITFIKSATCSLHFPNHYPTAPSVQFYGWYVQNVNRAWTLPLQLRSYYTLSTENWTRCWPPPSRKEPHCCDNVVHCLRKKRKRGFKHRVKY